MYRARDIFGVKSLTIVTQSYHVPRAVYIARALGLDAYAVPAIDPTPQFSVLDIERSVREVFASVKVVIDLTVRRVPEYLGDAIPLSGDGEVTWHY